MSDVAIVGSAVISNGIYVQPEDDLIMRCLVAAARDAVCKKTKFALLLG